MADVLVIHGDTDVIAVMERQTPILITEDTDQSFIVVTKVGPQGPPGPAGNGFVHIQNTPAATWIIDHTVGRKPVVTVYSNSGEEILTDVVSSSTQVTITFASPIAGQAILV